MELTQRDFLFMVVGSWAAWGMLLLAYLVRQYAVSRRMRKAATAQGSVIKPLSEIWRSEWVFYQWCEVTAFGDPEPMYSRGDRRSPDDAMIAAQNYDEWADAARGILALMRQSDEKKTLDTQ